MINISLTEPTEDFIESLKEQYSNHQLLKINLLANYFIVRTLYSKEFDEIAEKYDISDDKQLEQLKIEALKLSVVYPTGFSTYISSEDGYPAGLVDNLYEKTMAVSGLAAPDDVEALGGIFPKPDEAKLDELKKKYDKNVLIGINTNVGYYIVKGITSQEFYDIKAKVREITESKPDMDAETINMTMEELMLEASLVWPEGFYDKKSAGQVPTGIMSIVAGYVVEATGWGEPDIEIIE